MFTVCWGAKGGSGTTVVAATMALLADPPALLVDLAGDLPLALGIAPPAGPGLAEWAASTAPPDRIDLLATPIAPGLELVHRGDGTAGARWAELARHLGRRPGSVIVDAGTSPPPAQLVAAADRTLVVTRPCYLAVRRAATHAHLIDGIVLVDEPGRVLGRDEIEASLGAPVVAEILLDPAVARAVDSGLLVARLPRGYRRSLEAA